MAELIAALISVHVAALVDPHCLPDQLPVLSDELPVLSDEPPVLSDQPASLV